MKKSIEEKVYIQLRVNSVYKQMIEQIATKKGMTVTDYMMSSALPEIYKTKEELKKEVELAIEKQLEDKFQDFLNSQ